MNREDPYRDQAERLRKRIEKINESTNEDSSLPPRSDLHRLKKKKTKWKLKYPIIRILVLVFILLPITIFSIYSYLEGKNHIGSEKASVSSQGFETIDYEKPKKTKKNKANETHQNTDGKNGAAQQNENNINPASTKNTETEAQSTGVSEQKNGIIQQSVSSKTTTNGQDTDKNGSGQDTSTTKNSSQDRIIYHTVQPQETLFRIAIYYYHSDAGIEIIKQANHIQNNNNIVAGQVLKIPLKK
jgi:cytoskeletal protein RodZ